MGKKDRYSPSEFIGLTEIQSIILKEYGWIFRVQPSPDVGIDAQIETVEDGDPTAKLIAVQVKKGTSNFYLTADRTKASYYATPNHYEYWTDASIPVFVMGLLDDGKVYWQYASDKTMYKKLGKSYRLDIPLENTLDLNSKETIEAICIGHIDQLNINADREKILNSVLEYNSEINYVLKDYNSTLVNIINHLDHYTTRTDELTAKGSSALGLSSVEKVKMGNIIVEKYTLQINALANRLKPEINMSKKYFEEIKLLMLRKREILKVNIDDKMLESLLILPQIEKYIESLNKNIHTTELMDKSIQDHPKFSSKFSTAQKNIKMNFAKLKNLQTSIRDFMVDEKKTYNNV